MKIRELYNKLSEHFPTELSCSWDNDGLMCCTDSEREVKKVLCALDVTESIVDYAIENGFDLIISHHPLIFHPLKSVTDSTTPAKKVVKLIQNGISVFSFHTRADCAEGGVNDMLASALGLHKTERFGEGGMGRIGEIEAPCSLSEFAKTVKALISAPCVNYAGEKTVHRVALLGGDGDDFVEAAKEAGADTYLSGDLSYNVMLDAPELEINLIEAGHFYTEKYITCRFAKLLQELCPEIETEIKDSTVISSI